MKKPKVILFDVNETLLDLAPLKNSINKALENESAAEIWFSKLLHYSLVETISNSYHDFSEIGAAIMKMISGNFGKSFPEDEISNILKPVNQLPAYDEVPEALKKLKELNFELIAFSNGKPEVLKRQLDFAGIDKNFDHIISVEECKKYKPHPDAYKYVLKKTGFKADEAMMVAAHGWDVAGAARAGLQTIFVKRKGKHVFPLADKPTFQIEKISELTDIL